MRKVLFGAIGAGLILTMVVPSVVGAETLRGQIVDQACYLKNKPDNAGKDHKMPAETKDCAVACAKQGYPLALLTADGKVYQIGGWLAGNKNAKLIPHISHTVDLTGDTLGEGDTVMIHATDLKMVSAK
jgi:hypothetical protein